MLILLLKTSLTIVADKPIWIVSVHEQTRETTNIKTTTLTHPLWFFVREKNTLLYSTSLEQHKLLQIAIIPVLIIIIIIYKYD